MCNGSKFFVVLVPLALNWLVDLYSLYGYYAIEVNKCSALPDASSSNAAPTSNVCGHHPVGKFFGKCTELKIKLDRCFREEKALKRMANFEESKKIKERLKAYRKEMGAKVPE
ncbi:hypothetical protein HPP92_009108 [Vanilla planifolia]|uniref:COX assembly mitochondrial protein n=1 Tax=Vanilla planifolia TaxID=51239 RepID=A0A835V735_VANPL|nr:hypothetical protein HPP92_009201 [Vanilla planifolia]KAG0487013.1 hypothetical protein HPP92_009108 [Vanilla planifolia]